jgi:hypothetical protein
VETAERFADGLVTVEELRATYRAARRVSLDYSKKNPGDPRQFNLIASADATSSCSFDAAHTGALDAGWSSVDGELQWESPCHAALAKLAHDIFGNPFRPITLDPDWITSSGTELAWQMYDTRDFSLMPILADALQDAGCDDAAILDHCRDPNRVHVRGCWLVDLLLGRS